MLKADNLSKSYGIYKLFENVSFVINPGEKLGLVGINGSGKTTLLRILAGLEEPDTGTVFLSPGESLAYLPQTMEQSSTEPLRVVLESARGELPKIEERMRLVEGEMSKAGVSEVALGRLLAEYEDLRSSFEALGGYEFGLRIGQVMTGLELDDVDLDRPMETLSGGQKIKVALARVLLANASILLMDEPTNNLDLPALLWLEEYLKEYKGATVIVSHDRKLLDRVVSQIIEIDEYKHTSAVYCGDFSGYIRQKQTERKKWEDAYQNQQAWIRKTEEDIRRTKQQAQKTEASTNDSFARRLAKKVSKKAKAREHRLDRLLESEDLLDEPNKEWGLKLELSSQIPASAGVLRAEGISWRYGHSEILHNISLELRGKDRVAILGRNGSGKTTLLKILVGELHPQTGTVWVGKDVRIGYFSQERTGIDLSRTVLDEFRHGVAMPEHEARGFLSYFLFFGDEVFKSMGDLSLGERAKLILAKIVASGANALVLDEPTNHMDMRSMSVIEFALSKFSGSILMVSHDRYFIGNIGIDRVLILENGHLVNPPGGVEEYERALSHG